MKKFIYRPIYYEFPVFQIMYVFIWIPIGFIFSYVLAAVVLEIVTNIMVWILNLLLPMSIQMFVMSGRMWAMTDGMRMPVAIAFDFLLLIVGLELIISFLKKKKIEGGFCE